MYWCIRFYSEFLAQDIACAKDGFCPDKIQSVKKKATSQSQEVKETQKSDYKGCYLKNHPLFQAAPTAGLDNSSYDRSEEVDRERNDRSQKVKLPSYEKKRRNKQWQGRLLCIWHIFTLLNDFSHQLLLQIRPTDIKKSLNVESVIVEEEVTDSKKVLIWINCKHAK